MLSIPGKTTAVQWTRKQAAANSRGTLSKKKKNEKNKGAFRKGPLRKRRGLTSF